jgi:general L-amino acid transport system substrate-binding protein
MAALVIMAGQSLRADTLAKVKKKGFVQCGVSQGLAGFSSPNAKGQWAGLDVDYCRALAAVVLGDAKKVKFTPLSAKERFTALQSGEIDILSRNTTWTMLRDTALGLDFVGVTYYDGQGFMVRKDLGVQSVNDLNGATICVNLGTTTELNVADYFRSRNMKYKLVTFEKTDEVVKAYDAGRCDAYTTDQSGLYAMRLRLKKPTEHKILPEVISKEPLGPVVRQGDDRWADIARWTLMAALQAEELGLNSTNVKDKKEQKATPARQRLLGLEGDMGQHLGLENDWAYQMIAQVGNYAEWFKRNLGPDTPLDIAREQNRLWRDGGLHYPMPIR